MNAIKQIENKEEWKGLILEHANSNLSQTEFWAKKNISLVKFGYYRSIFLKKEKTSSDKSSFTPIQIKKTESAPADIRLVLPNGFQCFLSGKIDSVQIKQLLGVLLSC